ncbi:MAG: hypothetical protein AAGA03_09095 [Planctomycetota bacterium]
MPSVPASDARDGVKMLHLWAIRDHLLAGLAVCLITLHFSQDNSVCRVVRVRSQSGELRQYQVAEDSQRLKQLQRAIENHHRPKVSRQQLVAKWRLETAQHYASLSPIDQPDPKAFGDKPAEESYFRSVGYVEAKPVLEAVASDDMSSSTADGQVQGSTSHRAFWQEQARQANERLRSESERVRRRRQSAPPIQIGPPQLPPPSIPMIRLSFAMAAVTVLLFGVWHWVAPPITMPTFLVPDAASLNRRPELSDEFEPVDDVVALTLPTSFARITQPLPNRLRSGCAAGLVIWAFACLIGRWI